MAIKLASAIGEQRQPIGILEGLDAAINKTGDAIQAEQQRQKAEAAKKAEQEQRLKDLLASHTNITPPEKALLEQRAEYENFAKEGDFQIKKAALDPNVTPMQLEKMQKDFIYGLQDRKNKYEIDYDVIHKASELNKAGTHDDTLFQNFLAGKENPTRVAEMANDDFMAASEADRAGKMVGENGMKATDTKVSYQGANYFKLPFEEQKKIDTREKLNQLVTQKVPGVEPAAKGYFGKDFDFKSYTEKLDKTDPQTGEYIYTFKEEDVNKDADRFASSMIGDGNFGSKDHYLQQKAYETAAIKAAVDAGVPQEQMADAVKEFVQVIAKEDFKRAAATAYQNRIKDKKEVEKAPRGEKTDFNINIGGGGENKYWKFGKPQTTNVREGAMRNTDTKEVIKGKEGNLVDYDYVSMQTKVPADNPPITVGNNSGMHYQGVYKNKDNGEIAYFKFTKAADGSGEEILVPMSELKSSTYTDIKTNVGEDDFEKAAAIGKYAPKKETAKGKKVTKEEVKNKLAGF